LIFLNSGEAKRNFWMESTYGKASTVFPLKEEELKRVSSPLVGEGYASQI
jgi:hypothetical protein